MGPLTITTRFHHHEPGSQHLNHWTASVFGSERTAYGRGPTQSQAIKDAVDKYFKVQVVEGLSFAAGCEHG